MYCKKCGNKLPDGSKFCGVCGAKQDVKMVQQSLRRVKTEKAQYDFKPLILIIGLFIVIGVIGYRGYKYMNQPEKIIVGVWAVSDENLNETGDKYEFRKDGTFVIGTTVGQWSFDEKDKLRLTTWNEEYTFNCELISRVFERKKLMLRYDNEIMYLEKE